MERALRSAISTAALVNGLGQPTIIVQPANRTASLFADVTFNVSAQGAEGLSYQWQFNGLAIQGAVARTLTVTNVAKANAGSYSVVVSAAADSVIPSE